MDNISIIKKFMSYANYDPNQKTYNLFSASYAYKKAIDKITSLSPFDPTGAFSVLYAKQAFIAIIKESKVSMYDMLTKPYCLNEEISMWQVFNTPHVLDLEKEILDRFDEVLSIVKSNKQIGNRDFEAERNLICQSIEIVVDALPECNEDLFLRGGPIAPLSLISTKIHVFNWLADCLLMLETANDGLYLCFIRNMDEDNSDNYIKATADGFFGFYIKSNGTILSINEKVHEKFPGEHKLHRNARYSNDKKYSLFPYSIFRFADHDYKGVATTHMIDSNGLDFLTLSPDSYQPLILAMMMLNAKYAGMPLDDIPQKYVDSLLPVNLALPTPGQEIMVPEQSSIISVNKTLLMDMTSEGVLSGDYAKTLSRSNENKGRDWKEYGDFPTTENIFVELYGDGFNLNTTELLESNPHLKYLASTELCVSNDTPNSEFVGTHIQFEIVAYKQAREQLAEYIRDKMFEEYNRFGGKNAVISWFNNLLIRNKQKIFKYCIQKYQMEQQPISDAAGTPLPCRMLYIENKHSDPLDGHYSINTKVPFNQYRKYDHNNQPIYNSGLNCCINTTTSASMFFTFIIDSWEDIQAVVGDSETIPKILIGYKRDGHCVSGNPILDATDKCSGIGTPFEEAELQINKRYWSRSKWESYCFHNHIPFEKYNEIIPKYVPERCSSLQFNFSVCFSKRGFAKLLKGQA